MAAFAICAAPTPAPTPPPPSTPSPAPPPANLATGNTPTATTSTTTTTAPPAAAALGTRGETPPVSMHGEVACGIGIGLGGGIGIGTRGGIEGGGVGLGEGGRQEGVKEEEGCRLGGVVDVIEGSSEPILVSGLTPAKSVSVSVATSGSCQELPVPQRDLEREGRETGGGGGGGESKREGGEGGGEGGGERGPRGGRRGREPAVDDLAGVDEDVDSFVEFLRRKARVPP